MIEESMRDAPILPDLFEDLLPHSCRHIVAVAEDPHVFVCLHCRTIFAAGSPRDGHDFESHVMKHESCVLRDDRLLTDGLDAFTMDASYEEAEKNRIRVLLMRRLARGLSSSKYPVAAAPIPALLPEPVIVDIEESLVESWPRNPPFSVIQDVLPFDKYTKTQYLSAKKATSKSARGCRKSVEKRQRAEEKNVDVKIPVRACDQGPKALGQAVSKIKKEEILLPEAPAPPPPPPPTGWACDTCTMRNSHLEKKCSTCLTWKSANAEVFYD